MTFLRKDESLRLSRIKNGWNLDYNYETDSIDKEGRKETDYECDSYAFPSLEQAMAKLTELAGEIK